jgi:hypothetical protein
MFDEREKNLPKWAQETIARYRKDLLRPKVELLQVRYAALMELLECAAKGGHLGAKEIVSVLSGYGLEMVKE